MTRLRHLRRHRGRVGRLSRQRSQTRCRRQSERGLPASPRSDRCKLEVIPEITLAFKNLIDNAARHNDSEKPTVDVQLRTDEASTKVIISNNGPGIPEQELIAVNQAEVTPLNHGTGIGLWLVSWILDKSGAILTYSTGDTGTESTVQLTQTDDLLIFSNDFSPISHHNANQQLNAEAALVPLLIDCRFKMPRRFRIWIKNIFKFRCVFFLSVSIERLSTVFHHDFPMVSRW